MAQTTGGFPFRKRCVVYVDAFNWYHSIFRHHPEWKWLNVQSLFEEIRKDDEVVRVKFFTALIDPDLKESPARERMSTYLSALITLPKVEIVKGKFQRRTVHCRAKCGQQYQVAEEKKTDVNIAVHLINDALKGIAEVAVLVSGDSDLEPAVQWVREVYREVRIIVYIPSLPNEERDRRNDFYRHLGVDCRFLPLDKMAIHQLKPTIVAPDGRTYSRPVSWR